MSEVIYLPLSLWVIYIVWCIFCTENFRVRLALNLLLGVMCYLTYLNKEIALYFVIAYVLVWLMYCIAHLTTEKVGGGVICLVVFAGIFVGCFLLMKGTLFSGMPNSYSSSNLQVLHLAWSWEKIRYLLYGLIYDIVFGVLAFGIFPVLVPAAFYQKKEKESWFYLFLLCSFLIGCITIAYMITLPEDFGSRAPRLHMRYLEPLVIPFYILMVDRIRKADYAEREETGVLQYRQRILGIGIVIFAMLLIGGSGGGSFLADNSTLLYYELFARFISKSEIILLLLRLLVAIAVIAGFIVVCKRKPVFLKLFGILFITLNVVNSAAGIFAGHYRYGIQEEKRQQAVYANEYLKDLQGNILLLSEGKDTSPEDKRLFDTYIDVEFFVCDMDGLEMQALLEDNVIDLAYERLRCDVSGDYYPNLSHVDYIIVKNDYDVRLMEDSAEKLEDFPLQGYSIYKNLDSGKMYVTGET